MKLSVQRIAAVVLVRGDEVLLTKRAADAKWAANLWQIPGGVVEYDESVIEGAIRETEEEMGVKVAADDLSFLGVVNYDTTAVGAADTFCFMTTRWIGEPYIAEPHKCQEMKWFKLDALPADSIPHVLNLLADINHANFVYVADGKVKDDR